jgi:endonuclease YncB( thermonuclease family)
MAILIPLRAWRGAVRRTLSVRFVLALAMTISFAAVLALSLPLSGSLSLPAIDLPSSTTSRSGDLAGIARVTDGDTLRIGAQAIRLNGIAAPERSEPGGSESTRYLRALVEGRDIACRDTGARTYGRIVATCQLTNGRDIGAAMVEGGHARDCARYSGGRYAGAEQRARASGRDLSKTYPLPRYC